MQRSLPRRIIETSAPRKTLKATEIGHKSRNEQSFCGGFSQNKKNCSKLFLFFLHFPG
jgi:hypothetical protein